MLKLKPISNSMKSNKRYVFTTPVGALLPKLKILFEHTRKLGSCDYFDIIYSTYRLVYNMDECRIFGKADFDVNFPRLRWKLEAFDQIAGWGPVYAYNIQRGLLNLMLLTDCMFP